MWNSRARLRLLLLIRSVRSHPRIQTQVSPKTLTLTLIPPSPTPPSRWFPNPRFVSSTTEPDPTSESVSGGNESGTDETGDTQATLTWDFKESDPSFVNFEDGDEKVEIFGEISEENVASEALGEGMEAEVSEIDQEQVNKVVSILQGSSGDPIEPSLGNMLPSLSLSEEFVVRVIEASDNVGGNLIDFFRWASENEESVKSSRTVELLVRSIGNYSGLTKMEAYMLWDLVKELGKEKGILSTEILNELISMFWKLEKGKAALEVFNMFDEFGCLADGNSYFFVIGALGKRSMFDAGWGVCEKMLESGNLPDGQKIGQIVKFLCKGKKVKDAHLVYLMAKEKKIAHLTSSLDPLICGLARSDETVPLALELLEDYPKGTNKYANKIFGSVVKGLCRIQSVKEAKGLLLKMVNSGPMPGSAVFNYVITALSKAGEMEDAVALVKLMEGRGLRPDVYTYTVVMSGFAKGGLMDEAYKIYSEAKKRHSKLSPATYHVLIRGYCKMEDYAKALECMNEMKQGGVKPNTDEYSKMIQTLCLKALDWRTAEKLLEEMEKCGLYLKGTTRSLIAAVKELEEEAAREDSRPSTPS